jgi:two-component system, chemotaxis family, protein-glutamate methylesterase/glutaminase
VYELVMMGASWGGLDAVSRVLGALPSDFPAPVVVVQHRGVDSRSGALETILGSGGGLPVREIDDKDAIEPGVAHVAPADYHLFVERGSFALTVEDRVQYSRPSIDVAFESASDAYGPRMIAVLLTGANEDGAAGMLAVRARGGITVVQDPASAAKPEMPQAALDAGAAVKVLALDRIAPFLIAACAGERRVA